MSLDRVFDWIQMRCYKCGFNRLGHFFGHLAASEPSLFAPVTELEPLTVEELVPEVRSGQTWSLDELLTPPLRVIDFDFTYNDNRGIDIELDITFPTSPLDIN